VWVEGLNRGRQFPKSSLENEIEAKLRSRDVPVIASGGAGTAEHLAEGVIDGHADAVLVASIVHYGTYTVRELKDHMASRGIPVRLT